MPQGRKWAGALFLLALVVRAQFSGVAYPFFQGFLLAITLLAVGLLLLTSYWNVQCLDGASGPIVPLLCLLLWSLGSLWWSADPGQGIREFATLLLGLLSFVLAAHLISPDRGRFSGEKLTVLLVVFPVTLYALFQRFFGFRSMGKSLTGIDVPGSQGAVIYGIISQARVFGAFLNSNILAGFLAVAIPFSIAIALDERNSWRRSVLSSLVILECLTLFLTGSLGGILAAIGGTGLFLFLSVRPGKGIILSGVFAAVVGLASVFLIRGTAFLTGPENSLGQRVGYILAGARMGAEHPLSGWGTGAVSSALVGYIPPGIRPVTDPHNFFVYIWASWGIVGVTLFAAFLTAWALSIIRAVGKDRNNLVLAGLVGSSAGFLLHSLVDMDFSTPESAFFGWAVMGAALGMAAGINGREKAAEAEVGLSAGYSIFLAGVVLALIIPAVIYSRGEIYGFLGQRAFEEGNFSEAREMYHNALGIIPFSGRFTLMEGISLVSAGKAGEANSVFQRAGLLTDRSPYPPWELAKLAGSAGDYEKALSYLKMALERYPSSPWIRVDIGRALAGLGRWEEAGYMFREVAGFGQFDRRAVDMAKKLLAEIGARPGPAGDEMTKGR